jgi:DNA helicase-2/ATP-dependent DNA helicase PcrA
LRRRNVPYKIYGGLSFYQRKEIKDLLAYFKIVVNKQDDESLKRVINYPKRGIGKTSIDRLEQHARENNVSMWQAISKLKELNIGLNTRAVSQMLSFAEMINEFTGNINEKDAFYLGKEIAEKSGLLKELFADKSPEAIARHENVQELLNGIKEFADTDIEGEERFLNNYIESVALLTNEDNEKDEDRNKVTLMTIHSAKGLEFRNVYIVGVEERLFPSEMSSYSPKELEEERRLFYVAVTRAETELIISFSRQRYRWGNLHDCTPSRFIKDIDVGFVDFHSAYDEKKSFTTERNKYNTSPSEKKFSGGLFKEQNIKKEKTAGSVVNTNFNRKLTKVDKGAGGNISDIIEISQGAKVKHNRFGEGKVISIEGSYPNTKAVIEFTDAGKKNLLLKFAKLQVIG